MVLQVDNVAHWGDILQMAVLELIRKVCRSNPNEKGKYIKIILALLQSTSSAVVYECAVTLVSLSNAPSAIKAAANCYCQMLVSQSDNNVKLIVLDRLQVIPPWFCSVLTRLNMPFHSPCLLASTPRATCAMFLILPSLIHICSLV